MKKLIYITLVMFTIVSCSTDTIVNTETASINTGVDANEWVVIPAGNYFSGMHNAKEMIDYDYQIMRTHVTNAQYAQFLKEALAKKAIKIAEGDVMGYYEGDPFDNYLHEFEITPGDKLYIPLEKEGTHIKLNNNQFIIDKGFENHPVVNVTWFGANAYAKFYGYRLPTEKEWEKAARGEDTRAYPWGNEVSNKVTNYASGKNTLQKIIGGNIARTTPVGYYNGKTYGDFQTLDNRSPYGLYDMGGNVWQWVGDDYPKVHYRYMRGGSFTNYEYNLFVWARNSAGPDHYSINLGFRCAGDPKAELKPENVVADSTQVEQILE